MNLRQFFMIALCAGALLAAPGLASAASTSPVAVAYVRANGTSYQVDPLRSMWDSNKFQVTTLPIYQGLSFYKAHVDFYPGAAFGWSPNEIGLRINSVGGDAVRCSYRNQTVTGSPVKVSFDVFCARPFSSTQWEYAMSDFQIAVFYGGTYSSFAIVEYDGTVAAGSPFRRVGLGLATQRNGTGYYQITAYGPSPANANIHVQGTGSSGTTCEAQSQRAYVFPNSALDRVVVYVSCVNIGGQNVDSQFRVEANFETTANDNNSAYLTSNDPMYGGVASQFPLTPAAQVVRCTRPDGSAITGCWNVALPYGGFASTASFITAMRRPNEQEDLPFGNYCKVASYSASPYRVAVQCYHSNGTPVDATFGQISETAWYPR